jgi:hypothetical protein
VIGHERVVLWPMVELLDCQEAREVNPAVHRLQVDDVATELPFGPVVVPV